jgi:gliding motility-associated-like protein
MISQMNHKDSSIRVFAQVRKYAFLRILLTGMSLLLTGLSLQSMATPGHGDSRLGGMSISIKKDFALANGSAQDIVVVNVSPTPVPGEQIEFIINGGSGGYPNIPTDAFGNATLPLSSPTAGTISVEAEYVNPVTGVTTIIGTVTVTFIATAGPVNPATSHIVVLSSPATANGVSTDEVEVQVYDIFGNPVTGQNVTFSIISGTANMQGSVTLPIINGVAVMYLNSTVANTVEVQADAGGVILTSNDGTGNSFATIAFVAGPPDPSKSIISVLASPATANGTATDEVQVQLFDAFGNPVLVSTSVTFSIFSGTANLVGPATIIVTNGVGVMFLNSTVAGNVVVQANLGGTAISNGTGGNSVTVVFVAGPPDPTLSYITVIQSPEPADGSSTDIVQVHLFDAFGNPISENVTFSILGGTATFTSPTTVPTTNGITPTVTLVSTVAGNVQVQAIAADGTVLTANDGTGNKYATVVFVAGPVDPANPLTALIVDVPTSPADGTTQDVIHAHLVDVNNNVVPNATVVFTITGGTASGTAVTTTLTVTSDANGNATVDITNLQIGTVIFTATANGISIINGSPATVTFTQPPPSTSNPATALIVDVPVAPPNNSTAAVIHAHIVDVNGNPVPNATVIFTMTGGTAAGTATVTTGYTITTDANGNATIDITNTAAGTVIFTATVNGQPITNGSPATVTFVFGSPSVTNPATQLIVVVTGSPVGSTPNTVQAHIVDANGFPVPNATVVFSIAGGTAAANAIIAGGLTVTTDANGNATINITDITAGTVIFTATVNGIPITNNSPATVTFVAGAPSATGGNTELTIIVNNSVANGTSTDSLQALITDVNGNPVANTTVTFLIESGGTAGGTAVFMETVTATTNSSGIATIGVSNTVAGTVEIGAQIGGTDITGSPALITFVNAPDVNNPATQLIVIVYEALADGTSTTVVKAHIVDQNGQPISDRSIVFTIDSGTAQITTPQPVMTDNNGDALISLTSTTSGYVLITATVDGTPIIFGSPARVYFAAINIYVPRVFTPNADGTNDVLKPILVGIATFHYFTVYNRWGNIIFTTQDPNIGWDGTFKGVSQPVETYLWIAEGINTEGKKIVQKGMTSLVR